MHLFFLTTLNIITLITLLSDFLLYNIFKEIDIQPINLLKNVKVKFSRLD